MKRIIKKDAIYSIAVLTLVGLIPHLFMSDPRFPQVFSKVYEYVPQSFFADVTPARFDMLFQFLVWTVPYYASLIVSWMHASHAKEPCFLLPLETELLVLSYGFRLPAIHVLILSIMAVFVLIAELSVCLEKDRDPKGECKAIGAVGGARKTLLAVLFTTLGIVVHNLMLLYEAVRILDATGVFVLGLYPVMMVLMFFIPILYRDETVFHVAPIRILLGIMLISLALYCPVFIVMTWNDAMLRGHFFQIIISFGLFFLSSAIMKRQ